MVFDAKPIPTLDEVVSKLNRALYFTKCDLTKGFWQILLSEDCKAYTAFQTSRGLMEFRTYGVQLQVTLPIYIRLHVSKSHDRHTRRIRLMSSSSAIHGKNLYKISKRYWKHCEPQEL